MYLYGGNIMAEKHPLFLDGTFFKVLTKPCQKNNPRRYRHGIINYTWFTDFLQEVKHQVLNFLYLHLDDCMTARFILHNIMLCENIVPTCLRIHDTCVIHTTIVCRMNQSGGHIPFHLDTPDVISAQLHIGNGTSGEATNYDDGSTIKNPGNCVHSVPFKHGQLQIVFLEKCLMKQNIDKDHKESLISI